MRTCTVHVDVDVDVATTYIYTWFRLPSAGKESGYVGERFDWFITARYVSLFFDLGGGKYRISSRWLAKQPADMKEVNKLLDDKLEKLKKEIKRLSE